MAIANTTLARPYAKAAFEVALNAKALPEWSALLMVLGQICLDKQTIQFIQSPHVNAEQATALLCDVAGSAMNESGKNFVRLLADNNKLVVLPEIAELFEAYRAEHEKICEVTVTSFMPLTEGQQEKLIAALKNRLQREITLSYEIDKSLLGGAVVRAGDLVIDGSVYSRLRKMETNLVA